jgi:GNAT superfamily N-acetyltransferase
MERTEMNWTIQLEPDEEEVRALRRRLKNFNIAQAQADEGQGLAIFVKDDEERLLAGVYGWLWGGCLEVDYLWVDEGQRGQGIGRKLMLELEEEAQKRGCHTAVLDTYSFQAPGFYENLGYEAFGIVDGYGRGYQKYFFRKDF